MYPHPYCLVKAVNSAEKRARGLLSSDNGVAPAVVVRAGDNAVARERTQKMTKNDVTEGTGEPLGLMLRQVNDNGLDAVVLTQLYARHGWVVPAWGRPICPYRPDVIAAIAAGEQA
jgi:hypothetical protein